MRRERAIRQFNKFTIDYDAVAGFVRGEENKQRGHATRESVEYVKVIFLLEAEEFYDRARLILHNLCDCQDKLPESRTYGLWPTIVENKLEHEKVVDYNWADFIGTELIRILKEKEDLLGAELADKVRNSLRLAARCTMKRHVGLDYTNVICMSCFVLTSIGEILGDTELFEAGKKELSRFLEYTRVNGTFNEYNSPCYINVAAGAIANMIAYFEDEECRKMAIELNDYMWEMVARQYSSIFNEYTPPYSRTYSDLDSDDKWAAYMIGYATNGRFGKLPPMDGVIGGMDKLDASEITCPEKFYPLFEESGWYQIYCYKRNQLRSKEEDLTIVQDLDSPDLLTYSYKTDRYIFGSYQKTDLWEQRRTLMTIWNPVEKRCLKLCAQKDGVDFSSAMAYTFQEKESALVLLGFANDHGDKHYIVDPLNNGTIKAKKLSFLLKTGAAAKGLQFERDGEEYILRDGAFQIRVKIWDWMFDGEPAEIRICEDGLEFVCFDALEEREIDLYALGVTYGAFSFAINQEPMGAQVKLCGERVSLYSEEWGHGIEGYSVPKSYNECIRSTNID